MAEEKKEKRKKYMQEYYKKNKAKLKKQALNYYWENRDEIREKFLKKYHKNKNEIREKAIVKRIHKIMDGEKDLWNIRKKDYKGRIITKNDWLKSGGFIDIETFAHITGKSVREIIGKAQKHGFNFTNNVHSAFLLFFDVVAVV